MKIIIFVETLKYGAGPALVEKAIIDGIIPLLLTNSPAEYGWLTARTVILPLHSDYDQLLQSVKDFCQNKTIVGVTTTHDGYIFLAATLVQQLLLPGPNIDVINDVLSKERQKKKITMSKIDTPSFFIARNSSMLYDYLQTHNTFPVVLKPSMGSSGLGVFKIASCDEYLHVADKLIWQCNRSCCSYLVEDYIAGDEYCVELFDGKVIGILLKRMSDIDPCSEISYIANPDISYQIYTNMVSVAESAAGVLALHWGPVHLDIIHSQGEFYLIEVNARIAGSWIPELIKDAYNIDLVDLLYNKITGKDVTIHHPGVKSSRTAMVDFILEPNDGVIMEQVANIPFIDKSFNGFFLKLGSRLFSEKKRVGYIYLSYDKKIYDRYVCFTLC